MCKTFSLKKPNFYLPIEGHLAYGETLQKLDLLSETYFSLPPDAIIYQYIPIYFP